MPSYTLVFRAIWNLTIDFQGGRCGIYGANCPEWLISMEVLVKSLNLYVRSSHWAFTISLLVMKFLQACNAYGIYCVPLYDTLGMCFRAFLCEFAYAWCDILSSSFFFLIFFPYEGVELNTHSWDVWCVLNTYAWCDIW